MTTNFDSSTLHWFNTGEVITVRNWNRSFTKYTWWWSHLRTIRTKWISATLEPSSLSKLHVKNTETSDSTSSYSMCVRSESSTWSDHFQNQFPQLSIALSPRRSNHVNFNRPPFLMKQRQNWGRLKFPISLPYKNNLWITILKKIKILQRVEYRKRKISKLKTLRNRKNRIQRDGTKIRTENPQFWGCPTRTKTRQKCDKTAYGKTSTRTNQQKFDRIEKYSSRSIEERSIKLFKIGKSWYLGNDCQIFESN